MGYVCIECGASVPCLVRDYGGGLNNIRLHRCSECHELADPYVEYEPLLLFLDIMLFKPQVYRHVLANLSSPLTVHLVWRLLIILVMLDMTVKAYLLDRQQGIYSESMRDLSLFLSRLILLYVAFHTLLDPSTQRLSLHTWLTKLLLWLVPLSLLENIASVSVMATLIAWDPMNRGWLTPWKRITGRERWRLFLLDLVGTWCISSYGKLMALLSVIWDYHWAFFFVMGGIVLCSNVLAIRLLLEHKIIEASPDSPVRRVINLIDIVVVVSAAVFMRGLVQLALYGMGCPVIFYVFI